MVRFVDVQNMIRWMGDRGIEPITTGMVAALERDFLRWAAFDKTPRVASHSPLGVIELMPASDSEIYGFKYVNGHPANPGRGFQTVTAFGVLADVHNGYPRFLAEMTLLTALRTAATSALAAKRLARADSRVHALIGAGSQAEFQALAFRAVLGIETLRVYDVDPAATAKLRRNLAPLGFDITVAPDPRTAVAGADVITTCTADKQNAVVLPDDCVLPGVHLNAIGGDCPGKTELDPRTVRRADVFVEFPEQTRIEGEIQRQPADFPVTELWEVLAGRRAGRTAQEQITLFDSVGFAIEDVTALKYLRDDVDGTDYAVDIDLIAAAEDPKDLFGLVTNHRPASARGQG
jgi:ornithine cyclodeaminase